MTRICAKSIPGNEKGEAADRPDAIREPASTPDRPSRNRFGRAVGRSSIAALISVAIVAGCGPDHHDTGAAKTVVIVSIDTTRRDHLSVYGYPRPTTPSLETLADDSVVFDQAIAVHTNTAPAHATILTGLYPPQHGSINNGVLINDDVTTLGEVLSARGFATAAFVSGKTLKAEFSGLDRGFSVYDDRFDGWERRAEATLTPAGSWLRAQDNDRSVFLFFHLFDPHFLYSPPDPYDSIGLDGRIAPPEPLPVGKLRESTRRDSVFWRRNADEWVRRYDGEIAYADRAVGGILDVLRETGRYERATVVVVSDHGETLTERPRVFDHGCRVTEEQIDIPLIVKFPGSALAGTVVHEQVSQIDIAPTILRQLDLPALDASAGIDLRALAQHPNDDPRPLFVMARREPRRLTDLGFEVPDQRRWDGPESMLAAVRLPPYKLVDYAFLLESDLRRLRNLADDPAERSLVEDTAVTARLGKLLDEWWQHNWSNASPSGTGLSRKSTEMLEALGYMESPGGTSARAEPDDDSPEVFSNGFEDGSGSAWSRNGAAD